MHDLNCKNPDDMCYKELAERTRHFKEKEGAEDMSYMYEDIFERGMERGRNEGIQLGRNEGIQLGRNEGIQLGRNEGIQLGRNEGIQLGRNEGIQSGIARGISSVVRGMLEIGKLSCEDIAKYTGMNIDEIRRMAKQ